MTQPSKMYKVLNLAQTDPATDPPANFLYLFARNGKLWVRNPLGTEEMLGSVDFDGIVSIPAWVDTTTYTLDSGDVYVLHNNKIWKLVAATSLNEEPGVSMDWNEVDFSALAHAQNTDYKLGRWIYNIDFEDEEEAGIIDLTLGPLRNYNYYRLDVDSLTSPHYTIKTVNLLSGVTKTGRFLLVVPATQTGSITFQDNADQKIGTANLVLEAGDWAEFEGAVNGKTTVIASNKLQGEGGGGNPFDQSLNTTNNVQFAQLKLPSIAADPTEKKVVTVNDDGIQESENIKSINDVVFSQIQIIDQNTSLVTTWQVIDGVLTNVT